MGSVKKIVTSALVLTGGAAVYATDTEAKETVQHRLPDEDVQQLESEIMEEALRHYANPLKRIEAEIDENNLQDRIQYEIQSGDTLSGIAQKFDIPMAEIVHENRISDIHRLDSGQKVNIRLKEKPYRVQFGDSIEEIAEDQGITLDELVAYNSVLRTTQYTLYPGQELKIPTAPPEPVHQPVQTPKEHGKTQVASASHNEEAKQAQDQEEDSSTKSTQEQEKQEASSKSQESPEDQASSSPATFAWPVQGPLTSPFGTRWGRMHNGIDISNGNPNAPIQAAGNGVVTDAYHHSGGYGNLVIIDHGGGYQTYYGHLSQINVHEGQPINQGHVVGLMGQTGNATGSHVHFEVRLNNKPVNPLEYLP